MRQLTRARVIWATLICSLTQNVWLGYQEYVVESSNRQALAYPAEWVAYRLTQLTRFADGVSEPDWADLGSRTWVYDSITEIVDFGFAAERIPTRGKPSEVAQRLGQLARRLEAYRDHAHRLALEVQGNPAEDRAKIQELARNAIDAGWGPPGGSGKPAGWTYGRDWNELNRALEQLLAEKW